MSIETLATQNKLTIGNKTLSERYNPNASIALKRVDSLALHLFNKFFPGLQNPTNFKDKFGSATSITGTPISLWYTGRSRSLNNSFLLEDGNNQYQAFMDSSINLLRLVVARQAKKGTGTQFGNPSLDIIELNAPKHKALCQDYPSGKIHYMRKSLRSSAIIRNDINNRNAVRMARGLNSDMIECDRRMTKKQLR